MKSLTELRGEFVKKFLEENWDEDAELMDITRESYEFGFDAAVDLLTKQGVAEFDEEAASDEGYKLNFINAVDSLQNVAFVRGARYQHQQNRAALSAMKSELGQRSQATIDKAIAASKLPSDKPSIFADVEFVDNGNNSYLKSKGAAQTMALHILEEQVDKLRAEKANEWKKMDEAKDAFFRVIDQLSAAVDQQAIEVNKLSELKGK